ncbi:efflux transporter periplasmic adaptor subunit [Pseudoalteromonas phenolica]|uniref:efflux RND transporter periplasmic adaptor subunit n=1 Tax=Pseudoalteromonas phenolica TaxID=161398 RepID=UPI00110BD0EA|nr:HlyD family efflux transporter periplasmic adaptor subunit [Pseudoalteromonas phenolica]TMN87592.1 efflux transporter periplasmic adaptor subunit [Pseudoalteromonas phenolica]
MIKDTSGQDQIVKQKPKLLKPALLLVGVLSAVTWTGFAMINADPAYMSVEKAQLQIAQVKQGDLVRDIAATGKIVAANAPKAYSPEQGFVTLKVKAGDTVELGQVIAEVDSPELNNSLKQQESELARLQGELARNELEARRQTLTLNKTLDLAQVELSAAERENRRAKLSIEKSLISQIDLEKAVDDLAKAKLTFKHAQQEVELAKDTLAFELQSSKSQFARQQLVVDELQRKVNNLHVRASVSGIIGNLLIQPKAMVSKNQALLTLVDLSAFEAELQVPESYANDLGIGMQVELKIGTELVVGSLSAISPEVNNREVTARVRFEQSSMSNIRQNQRLSGRILLENRSDVLMVKRGAFLNQGGFVAYKVNGERAERIEITTGVISINHVEVLAGLSQGDQIIISNYDTFKNADAVLLR